MTSRLTTWVMYEKRQPPSADYQFDPARFAELTLPTLLLAAAETAEWLLDATNAVADALPNVRVVSIDGYGHGAVLSAPERFTSEVLAFVRDSSPGGDDG